MADKVWTEWENEHSREIDEFAAHWREITGSWHVYHLKHTYRKIRPEDSVILKHKKYDLRYEKKKHIDLVIVEHYYKKRF